MLSVSFCKATVLKVMDQNTLDEVIRSVQLCVYKHLESLPERVQKSLIGNNMLPDTLSLSLGNKTQSQLQTSKTSESMDSLSLVERLTITEVCRKTNSVLTYSQLTDFL